MSNYRSNPNYRRNLPEKSRMMTPSIQNGFEEELNKFPIAMAYVPMQKWEKPVDYGVGLKQGTIFQELYKPFLGAGGYRV